MNAATSARRVARLGTVAGLVIAGFSLATPAQAAPRAIPIRSIPTVVEAVPFPLPVYDIEARIDRLPSAAYVVAARISGLKKATF